jgi:hypothetical protein
MSDEIDVDPSCAVCERRLLPGERLIGFVTRDGAEVGVCELCKPRAEAAGWLRPEEFEAAGGAGPARDRRRPRGAQALGGFLSRLSGPAEESAPEAPGREQPGRPESEEPAPERPIPAPALSTGTTIPEALSAFNGSNHRRTVAGLTRTLGPPRATAIAIENGDGLPAVRLTIAWELTWYQWEVGPNGRAHDVRESGKGETIAQLRSADRAWNLLVDADGTLEQKTSAAPADGE